MFDFNRHLARILTAGLFVSVGMLLGCEGRSPSAPGQSIPGQPTFSALTVKTIVPTSGVPAGGTAVAVSGSGFQAGATLTIGGIATSVIVESSTSIIANGVAFSGRIVSLSIARGTISLAPCIPMTWYAEKH